MVDNILGVCTRQHRLGSRQGARYGEPYRRDKCRQPVHEGSVSWDPAGIRPHSRPKGIAGLGMKDWTCASAVTHDRGINATRNALALGHEHPSEGTPAF